MLGNLPWTSLDYSNQPLQGCIDDFSMFNKLLTLDDVLATFFSSGPSLICSPLTICSSSQYQSIAPTATSNRICRLKTICSITQYVILAASLTSDTLCGNLTVCSNSQIELRAPTLSSDRVCVEIPTTFTTTATATVTTTIPQTLTFSTS